MLVGLPLQFKCPAIQHGHGEETTRCIHLEIMCNVNLSVNVPVCSCCISLSQYLASILSISPTYPLVFEPPSGAGRLGLHYGVPASRWCVTRGSDTNE